MKLFDEVRYHDVPQREYLPPSMQFLKDVVTGDLAAVEKALKSNPDLINAQVTYEYAHKIFYSGRYCHRMTALHLARYANNPVMLKLLLKSKRLRVLNARDYCLQTALFHEFGVATETLSCTKLLLESGIDIHAKNQKGQTAFHQMIKISDFEGASLIIDQVKKETFRKVSAVVLTFFYKDIQSIIMEYYTPEPTEFVNQVDDNNRSPLAIAVLALTSYNYFVTIRNAVKTIELLLDSNADCMAPMPMDLPDPQRKPKDKPQNPPLTIYGYIEKGRFLNSASIQSKLDEQRRRIAPPPNPKAACCAIL